MLGVFLPPFLAILIAAVLPSWRYRTIAATLLLMAVTIWLVYDGFTMLTDFSGFLVALIRLSAGMSGAIGAVLIWQHLKTNHFARAKPVQFAPQPADKLPKPSTFLLGLSLLSIPATYLTILVSAFL